MSKTGWKPKEIPLLNRPAMAGKVNLSPENFDKLVETQGVRVKVYRTAQCPNVKSIDGAEHEIDCELCHGSGFLDRHPNCTWAFIQSQELDKIPFSEGLYDGNSVVATFMNGIELQYFTLVELVDFTDIFYERIKRQSGQVDVLRYPAKRVNMVIDSNGVEYFEGSDFCLDPNDNIKWKANKGPAKSVIYSVHYESSVRFRATKAVHVNRFSQIDRKGGVEMTKMPEQWILEKIFFNEKFDRNTGEPLKNTIEEPTE
jgi:hypothetical protein